MKKTVKLIALALALVLLTACAGEKTTDGAADVPDAAADSTEFVPALDTEKDVELSAAVFFGNFEALDQVINHFNDIYPNVVITYESIGSSNSDFLMNNPSLDIFMTSNERGYPEESCLDLLAAGVDVSAFGDGLLDCNMVDGQLHAIPMGLSLRGIVVNKTLLEKEGLEVPQTWEALLDTMEALKQKGYTPLQGPDKAFSGLCYDMGMTMLSNDPELREKVSEGDRSGVEALSQIYERMLTLLEKGYIVPEVNAEYPEDNYDGAIMKFFEGDVPFWVCDTEKVSGMKKRESKSETFSAEPFEYEFTFAPLGDNGVYEFIEPWYGFAVNKDSDDVDYAVEFLRFMAREDELNTLASVKGVPSAAKNAQDERYTGLESIERVEAYAVYDGSVPAPVVTELGETARAILAGDVTDINGAIDYFLSD